MNAFDVENVEFDELLERLQDLSPVWPGVQQFYNTTKDRDFRGGRGPEGPHKSLRPSSRRGHRTGIPLNNTGQLRRSFSDPSHGQYRWQEDPVGWEHTSRHPALPHLERRGYSVVGLIEEDWDRIDDVIEMYLTTGKIEVPR